MKSNFHTHTYRCNHALGTDREYVEAAVARGLEVLGFSDHSPYIFPEGYYSNFRMRPEQTPEYVSSLSALRDEFADRIKIYIGYEMEYYPLFFDKTIEHVKSVGCDFIMLGQHFPGNEIGRQPCAWPTDSKAVLTEYVDQVIEGMKTGKFFCVVHPDVICFNGDTDFYRENMRRLCKEAKRLRVPLEINLLGMRGNRHYPNEEFWRVASDVGVKVILGCDAHRPCDLAVPENIEQGLRFADKFNLDLTEPRKPKFIK